MRPHSSSSSMLSVKVKTEKSDLEASTARNRLDAVLQCLVEKSDIEREQAGDELVKPVLTDLQSKDSSPASAGKRPSTRFPHQRRKKRKEAEDGGCEGGHQRPNAYTMKLFDRSVDLAQFNENTPLYPICRAWMRNKPSLREGALTPSPQPPAAALEDEEVADLMNGKCQDVYKLPEPAPCSLNNPEQPGRLRIPSPLPSTEKPLNLNMSRSNAPGVPTLLYNHMERWKKIRHRWKESSHRNQHRYTESMKILKEMFERQ